MRVRRMGFTIPRLHPVSYLTCILLVSLAYPKTVSRPVAVSQCILSRIPAVSLLYPDCIPTVSRPYPSASLSGHLYDIWDLALLHEHINWEFGLLERLVVQNNNSVLVVHRSRSQCILVCIPTCIPNCIPAMLK